MQSNSYRRNASFKSKLNKLYESFNHDDQIIIRETIKMLSSKGYSHGEEYDMMCSIHALCVLRSINNVESKYANKLDKLIEITPNRLRTDLKEQFLDIMMTILRHAKVVISN